MIARREVALRVRGTTSDSNDLADRREPAMTQNLAPDEKNAFRSRPAFYPPAAVLDMAIRI